MRTADQLTGRQKQLSGPENQLMRMEEEPEQEAEALAKRHAKVVVETPMEVENRPGT
jgi:hypothetical protein